MKNSLSPFNNDFVSTAGIDKLTTTTGVVRGLKCCEEFVKECYKKYSSVEIINSPYKINNYLQYTLLTNNRIRLFI